MHHVVFLSLYVTLHIPELHILLFLQTEFTWVGHVAQQQ